MFVGKGFRTPPSMINRPFSRTGSITPGMAMLLRMALTSGPDSMTSSSLRIRSYATIFSGIRVL